MFSRVGAQLRHKEIYTNSIEVKNPSVATNKISSTEKCDKIICKIFK
jgi:hypothetical protein